MVSRTERSRRDLVRPREHSVAYLLPYTHGDLESTAANGGLETGYVKVIIVFKDSAGLPLDLGLVSKRLKTEWALGIGLGATGEVQKLVEVEFLVGGPSP